MVSPAKRHFQMVSAQLAAAAVGKDEQGGMAGAGPYELMLVKLHADRRRLKDVLSVERKIEVKRELLPDYTDYVDGVLAGGRGAQDDVLVNIMIWRIDVGDFAGALQIAEYALGHGLTMPDQYERSLATVLAEEVADNALEVLRKGDGRFDAYLLLRVIALTDHHDMHDQVRAKLYKAAGLAHQSDAATALPYLNRALQLNERVGVKQDIARLVKQLGDAGQEQAST